MSARQFPGLKHGLSYTPEYRAWQTMRNRCTSPNSPAWSDYGGRGITICAEWLNDPAAFIAHVGLRPTSRHEIDRIENDRGYEPGNCRWVVRKVNDRNRRSNRFVEYRGERRTVAEWCELLALPSTTIAHRLNSGWGADRALSTPIRPIAPKGQAKHTLIVCADCSKRCTGTRCHSCENKRRPLIAAANKAGNFTERRAA